MGDGETSCAAQRIAPIQSRQARAGKGGVLIRILLCLIGMERVRGCYFPGLANNHAATAAAFNSNRKIPCIQPNTSHALRFSRCNYLTPPKPKAPKRFDVHLARAVAGNHHFLGLRRSKVESLLKFFPQPNKYS